MTACSVDGCDKPHRARGLCSTHYNQQHQPERHSGQARSVDCVVCGTPVTRSSSPKHLPTCSYQCRRDATFGVPLPADHWARWYGKSEPWSPPKALPARFISARCADCDCHFTLDRNTCALQPAANYCSGRCRRRAAKRRRTARERGQFETLRWADVIGVWLAMGRACAYCAEVTDNPDPDHVLALSRGGRNHISNILPACRQCNGDKRELTLAEWAADRARRGLVPRCTDYVTYDVRAPHLVVSEPAQRAA